MRKLLLLAIAAMPVFLFGQAQRTVLIEEFSNASCAPCAAQNPAFNTLLGANTDKVISVKYQVWFPGYDPFYEQNPDEVRARATFYNVGGVPVATIDGTEPGPTYGDGSGTWTADYTGGPYGYTQGVIDWTYAQTTPISMSVTHTLADDFSTFEATISITNESDAPFSLSDGRLHVVLVEDEVAFPEAPGSNGETTFYKVMRKMYPDQEGYALDAIGVGETATLTITGDVPSYIYQLDQLRIVAFVQDRANRSVAQAAISDIQAIENGADLAFASNLTAAPEGLCGATITPSVRISNAGNVDITEAVIEARINDVVVGMETFTGTLTNGQEATLTFDEVVLTDASNVLSFTVASMNQGANVDINRINNILPATSFASIPDTPLGTSLMEDNEGYDFEYPTVAVVNPQDGIEFSFTVVNRADLTTAAGAPIGGFGASDRSIFLNFYDWDPSAAPEFADLIYQKIDLTGVAGQTVQLSFDRAGAGYPFAAGATNDAVDVSISTDCGETFTSVWSGAGATLYTAPAVTSRFLPTAAQWATANVDVSEFAGNEILLRFRAITDWGNYVFLDNINVSVVTRTEELTQVADLKLYPNPVNDLLQVEMNLEEAAQLHMEVVNAMGQVVMSLPAQNLGTGLNKVSVDTKAMPNGVYYLRLSENKRELSRRFVVQH